MAGLTLFRREVLPVLAWLDRPPADERGPIPMALVPTPTAGDMERAGMLGGGPGSAPGERRCIEREDADEFIICSRNSQSVRVPRDSSHEEKNRGPSGLGCRVGVFNVRSVASVFEPSIGLLRNSSSVACSSAVMVDGSRHDDAMARWHVRGSGPNR